MKKFEKKNEKLNLKKGNNDDWGIMIRSVAEIFSLIENYENKEINFEFEFSYIEIYNEQIKDLLDESLNNPEIKKQPPTLREDPEEGVCLCGVSKHKPKTSEEVFEMLRIGNENRSTSATAANHVSSRSHAILLLYMKRTKKTIDGGKLINEIKYSTLSMIDLAGSER